MIQITVRDEALEIALYGRNSVGPVIERARDFYVPRVARDAYPYSCIFIETNYTRYIIIVRLKSYSLRTAQPAVSYSRETVITPSGDTHRIAYGTVQMCVT